MPVHRAADGRPGRRNRAALRSARRGVRLKLEALPTIFSIDQAIAAGEFLGPKRDGSFGARLN